MELSIDIETYSSVDLKKSGVYKYTESPDFEILLIACDWGNGSNCYDLLNLTDDTSAFLDSFITDLQDPNIIKTAHNAAFERTCLAKYFNIVLPPEQWRCTMVKCSTLGLPMSLGAVAKVLGTEHKDTGGKALINYFCKPCKPTKINKGRTRNLPHHAPEKWADFISYCAQDVVAEKSIKEKLSWYEIPDVEHELWCLDQRINDDGILMDMDFIHNALAINAEYRAKLVAEAVALTGISNPNSNTQLMSWLNEEQDEEVTTLRKGDVVNLLNSATDDTVKRVLTIRKELSKTSIKKYNAMVACCCSDNRARGLFQFYGASRTGRWAGRLVQMQNLTKWYGEDEEVMQIARDTVKQGNLDELELMFGNVIDILSGLIRTSFIAPEGQEYTVADFSSIEARVIAWLANEKWRLDVFKTHGKIYEASAAAMFHVPMDAVTKDMRQRGKVAELALGYQGGANALISMGALEKGIKEEDLPGIVQAWRKASPNIVQMWYDFQNCAIAAVEEGGEHSPCKGVKFFKKRGVLFMQLPSGRCLSYMRAHTSDGKFGRELRFEGVLDNTQWGIIKTYGGSLVENATQAIARDCLAYAMLNVAKAGHKIALHVHDEIACPGTASLEQLCKIMTQPAPWAKGLPLGADGFTSKFYRK